MDELRAITAKITRVLLNRPARSAVIVIATLMSALNAVHAQTRYRVVDLGSSAISGDCTAVAVNALGNVTGNCAASVVTSFFWDGALHILPTYRAVSERKA